MEKISNNRPITKKYNLTAIYFNRYLIFRYLTAFFFFINLYWMILAIGTMNKYSIIPIFLFIVDIAIIAEQTSKYWQKSNRLIVTKIGYIIQISCNIFLMIFCIFGYHRTVFPFINNSGNLLLIFVLFFGCLIGIFIEWRIWLIENDKDSYFSYLKKCEENSKNEG